MVKDLKEYEYYRTENGVLYCGDCLEILPFINNESIDLILTDPPYNISKSLVIQRNGGKFGHSKDIVYDFGEWDHGQVRWQEFIPEFVRVLKPYGVLILFYDRLWIGHIGLFLQNRYGFKVRHIGTWVKQNPTPQARKVRWQIGTEVFLIATKNQKSGHHFNYKLGQSPDYFTTSVNYKHEHPTQKPLPLIEWLLFYWSFEGDIVLDPFIGSGTTAVACERLGRKWIGIEISPDYCEIAKQRIEVEAKQIKLFM